MAKKVFSIQIECFQANKNKNGSQVAFANNVQQTDKGPAARHAISVNVPDQKLAEQLTPGKKYTVTITEE